MNPSPWAPLLPAALVGTDRQTPPTLPLPGGPGGLTQAIANTQASAAEQTLRQAAVLAVCQLASGAPLKPAQDTTTTPIAPPDPRPVLADARRVAHLRWLLDEGLAPERLLQECWQRMAERGCLLPHALLPASLRMGRRKAALRPALLPVLGARGQWLAAQSPEWRYAAASGTAERQNDAGDQGDAEASADASPTPTDHDVWQTGTLIERKAWLGALRRADPADARTALEQALPELPASERASLLAELAPRLSLDDEALLTALLKDRSAEVREKARAFLVALPASAHARRMGERMAALLSSPEAVRAGQPTAIDAPAHLDEAEAKAWKADLMEPTRPQHGTTMGERAWRLYQIVRQTPLHWWQAHTGADAATLLDLAPQTDWHEALKCGWLDALHTCAAAPDGDRDTPALVQQWASAFLQKKRAEWIRWGHLGHPGCDRASLLALLPRTEREPFWAEAIDALWEGEDAAAKAAATPVDANAADVSADTEKTTKAAAKKDQKRAQKLAEQIEQMASACASGEELSAPLARAVVQALHRLLERKALHQDWRLRQCLAQLPCLLPATVLPAVAQLPRFADEGPSLSEHLDTCQRAAQVRLDFGEVER